MEALAAVVRNSCELQRQANGTANPSLREGCNFSVFIEDWISKDVCEVGWAAMHLHQTKMEMHDEQAAPAARSGSWQLTCLRPGWEQG